MNNINKLNNYAQELVQHYGTYDGEGYFILLGNVPSHEQGKLANLYLESIDRETTECVHGKDFSIDNDYTCALLKLLKEDSQENRENFAITTRNNVIAYFKNNLQKILDSACEDHLHSIKNEQGYYLRTRPDNGEIYWGRYL